MILNGIATTEDACIPSFKDFVIINVCDMSYSAISGRARRAIVNAKVYRPAQGLQDTSSLINSFWLCRSGFEKPLARLFHINGF